MSNIQFKIATHIFHNNSLIFSMWSSLKVAHIPHSVGIRTYLLENVWRSIYLYIGSTYGGSALDDVATAVAVAGHQAEPFTGVLALAKFLFQTVLFLSCGVLCLSPPSVHPFHIGRCCINNSQLNNWLLHSIANIAISEIGLF